MTQEDIQCLIDELPDLNDFGIGIFNPERMGAAERQRELEKGQQDLLASIDDCNKVCEWLKQVDQTDTINTAHSSYGLKHIAEHDIGYVTNGVFIAAAIAAGFPYRIVKGSPNVLLGVSQKSLRDIMRRQKREGKANWALA